MHRNTTIAFKNTVYLNSTGSSSLAKGGSGDVLSGVMEDIVTSCRYDFRYIVINESNLTREAVERILEAGLLPGVWNINNPGEMDRFIAMGVKRFYTDFPAVLMKKLGVSPDLG